MAGLLASIISCAPRVRLSTASTSGAGITATEFFREAAGKSVQERDSMAVAAMLNGSIPAFLQKLVPVRFVYQDSLGQPHRVEIWVSSDYLSIGNNQDWVRLPLMPESAQTIADSLDCFLPSSALVDRIYEAAVVKLEPEPIYALRDSLPVFRQHHLMIEGQRKDRSGLIAGIKKDVVRSIRYFQSSRSNRVVIYGWHLPDGKPIQPVYAGHVNWYVDYSHGIRLISQRIRVDGKWRRMRELSADPLLAGIVCDGQPCMISY